MADQPSTSNAPATIVNQALHDLIFNVAVNIAEAAIVAEVPFLGAPIIRELDDLFINFIAGKIYDAIAGMETQGIIDIEIGIEATNANSAATALKQALQGGDKNAISQATQNFSAAFGKLVHFDGSATP